MQGTAALGSGMQACSYSWRRAEGPAPFEAATRLRGRIQLRPTTIERIERGSRLGKWRGSQRTGPCCRTPIHWDHAHNHASVSGEYVGAGSSVADRGGGPERLQVSAPQSRTTSPPPCPQEGQMTTINDTGERVAANVERVIIGKRQEVRLTLVALLCRGHLLIADVPGTGKTMLAKAGGRRARLTLP